MTEQTRRYKGCFGDTPIRYSMENIRFSSCPGNFTTPWVYQALSLHKAYEDSTGVLDLLGLPYKYMQIFGIIGNVKEKYRKKAEADGKRNKYRR